MGKQLNDSQIQSLIKKGETPLIKGLLKEGKKVNGKLKLNDKFILNID